MSSGVWETLQADAAGFMVKFKNYIEGDSSVMELVKIEPTKVSLSFLQIPDGRKEKKGGWVNQHLKGM